jgi:hypothetical protein
MSEFMYAGPAVPEPAGILLFAVGLVVVVLLRNWRR